MNLPSFDTWAAFFGAADMSDSVPLREWESILPSSLSNDETIGLLIEETEIFIMSVAPVTKDIQFFHHFTKVGGSRIKKDAEFFVGLQGFGSSAQPVIIDANVISTGVTVKAPSGAEVITFQSIDDVESDNHKLKTFKTKPFVLIPPSLASFITELKSYAPADVFLKLLAHLDDLDAPTYLFDDAVTEQHIDIKESDGLADVPPTTTSADLSFVFRWLWSAAHDLIPCVQSVMAGENMQKVQRWSSTLHSVHIKSQAVKSNTESTDVLKELSSSVQALSQAAQLGLTQQTTLPSTTSKHSFDKFPDAVKQMILFAGSPDMETPLSAPPATLRDLLACKNSTSAKQYLAHILQKEYRCLCVVPQSLAMAVYQGCLLWDNRAMPSNFSIFYLGEPTTKGDSHSKTLMYNMKITEGEGLSQTDFDEVTKSTFHFPNNAHELQTQIQNFIGLVSVIFGRNSYLVSQLYTWNSHIQDAFIMYKMGNENNKNFFTQVLYAIDTRVQNYLRSCKDASSRLNVNDAYLDFTRHQCEIDDGVFYLRTPPLRDATPDDPPNKRLRTNNTRDDDSQVTNPKLLQQCKLATGENYHKLFLKRGIAQPKQDGKALCLNYHIRGSCTKSCRRSHKPLSPEATKDLIAFCAECRKAA